MTTYVLYSQDEDSDVEILAVSKSAQDLQDRAAQIEFRGDDDTGETLEWVYLDGDIARAEFHGLDYWITPVREV